MIVPDEVANRGHEMTDDEIVAAYLANGETRAHAELMLAVHRRRVELPFGPQA